MRPKGVKGTCTKCGRHYAMDVSPPIGSTTSMDLEDDIITFDICPGCVRDKLSESLNSGIDEDDLMLIVV